MFHILPLLALVLFFPSTTAAEDLFTAAEHAPKKLRLVTQDYAPYTYMMNGVPSGPAVEMVETACSAAGEDCSIQVLPWARAQMMVKNGEADGLFVIGRNPDREHWLTFSSPFIRAEYGFFARTGDPFTFRSSASLKGKTIAAYGPSNTSLSLKSIIAGIPNCTLDIRPDDEAGFNKLEKGRTDLVFSNKCAGEELIAGLGLKHIRYTGKHSEVLYHVAFSKHHTDKKRVERFNRILRELINSGSVAAIFRRYGMNASPDMPELYFENCSSGPLR